MDELTKTRTIFQSTGRWHKGWYEERDGVVNVWSNYFQLWICGEKTWWLSLNHIDGAHSMIASRNCISTLREDLSIASIRNAMNRKTFMRAKKEICNVGGGREAFSRVESMLEECGYDDFFWDVVSRGNHIIQTALEKADELRAKIIALRQRSC